MTDRTLIKHLTESWPEMIETAMIKQEGVAEALKTSDQIVGRFFRHLQFVQILHKLNSRIIRHSQRRFSGVL